jgi:hypothetical protein
MTCEWFPKDPSVFLNFKFTSKFALIPVNIAYLQIQILFRLLSKKYETLIINITFVWT